MLLSHISHITLPPPPIHIAFLWIWHEHNTAQFTTVFGKFATISKLFTFFVSVYQNQNSTHKIYSSTFTNIWLDYPVKRKKYTQTDSLSHNPPTASSQGMKKKKRKGKWEKGRKERKGKVKCMFFFPLENDSHTCTWYTQNLLDQNAQSRPTLLRQISVVNCNLNSLSLFSKHCK